MAAPHPSQPGAPGGVYDGLSMFEEPPSLIDLDSSDESPAATLAGQTRPGPGFLDPLITIPNAEVEKAWDEAGDIGFKISDDIDFANLHPEVQRRLSVEARKYMPKSPSTDRHENSNTIPSNVIAQSTGQALAGNIMDPQGFMKETVDISVYDEGDPCCRAAQQAKKTHLLLFALQFPVL